MSAVATSTTDSIVTLTESAARQISSMQAEDKENAGKPLRVYVESGGLLACNNWNYEK